MIDIRVRNHDDCELDNVLKMLHELKHQGVNLMSKITEFAAREQADFTQINTKLDDVVAGVKHLDDMIVAFQNSQGQLSLEDQQALDAIETASKDVVTKAEAIDTTPPPVTAPPAPV